MLKDDDARTDARACRLTWLDDVESHVLGRATWLFEFNREGHLSTSRVQRHAAVHRSVGNRVDDAPRATDAARFDVPVPRRGPFHCRCCP